MWKHFCLKRAKQWQITLFMQTYYCFKWSYVDNTRTAKAASAKWNSAEAALYGFISFLTQLSCPLLRLSCCTSLGVLAPDLCNINLFCLLRIYLAFRQFQAQDAIFQFRRYFVYIDIFHIETARHWTAAALPAQVLLTFLFSCFILVNRYSQHILIDIKIDLIPVDAR